MRECAAQKEDPADRRWAGDPSATEVSASPAWFVAGVWSRLQRTANGDVVTSVAIVALASWSDVARATTNESRACLSDAARTDDYMVDVRAVLPHRDGVNERPARILLGELGQTRCDLLLAVRADPPGAFVGVHAEQPRHERPDGRGLSSGTFLAIGI